MNKIFQESRSETIARHTADMFHDLRMRPPEWAAELVEEYHRLVPEQARTISFHVLTDADLDGLGDAERVLKISKVLNANAQVMNRFRALYDENTMRFPADLQEAWVNCLREPYRAALKRDLAARDGLMCVPLPSSMGVSDVESVSNVTHQFANALSSIAPTMTDMVIDENDRPMIPGVLAALDALLGHVTSLRERYAQQLPPQDGAA